MDEVTDPSKVVCTGDGLRLAYVKRRTTILVDTRRAGPGELSAHCAGPSRAAFVELRDRGDATYTLGVRPQEPGDHLLHVQYEAEHVPGSPFKIPVSTGSLVKVTGPGLRDGVLAPDFDDYFLIDAQAAGPGEVTLRMRGQTGAFLLKTMKEGRRLHCHYSPQRPGIYAVHVNWSGVPLPDSPFQVYIFAYPDELKHHLAYGAISLHDHDHDEDFRSLDDTPL